MAWSPDGRRIVASVYRREPKVRLVAFSVTDGSAQAVGSTRWSSLNFFSWLPDGSGLVVTGSELDQFGGQVWLVSWPDGASRRITNDANTYSTATVSADSKSIAAINWRAASTMWSAPIGDLELAVRVPGDSESDFVSARNGHVIFRRCSRERCGLWTLAPDGSAPRPLTPPRFDADYPFSAALADVIVFRRLDEDGTRTMWRMDLDGGAPAEIPGSRNTALRSLRGPSKEAGGAKAFALHRGGRNVHLRGLPKGAGGAVDDCAFSRGASASGMLRTADRIAADRAGDRSWSTRSGSTGFRSHDRVPRTRD